MEKIKVNMNPNPLDVQTIHASQNDGEARQWEFELHNNGELIDTSEITEQLFFKAYKGGTEQLLPENGSTPTTSPFKGDIKYPQGLLNDQEFTYRQSPTESDGLAKITDIKGNTLIWNQQANPSGYVTGTYSNVSVTKSQDETYLIANGTASATAYIRLFSIGTLTMISGHKYLCVVPNDPNVAYYDDSTPRQYSQQFSSFMFTSNGSPIRPYARINSGVTSTNRRISFMMFDITQMGLDISSPSDFTSLFNLPYYAYNQGSLLSFNGNGIKTVGFNQWDEEWEVGAYNSTSGDKTDSVRDRIRNKNPIRIFPSINYFTSKGIQLYYYDANMNYLGWNNFSRPSIFTPPNDAYYINFNGLANSGATYKNDICINISDPSKNGTYEPYTSSTLSLPISTYFPTGMKSAGSVYDELTENKATQRLVYYKITGNETVSRWVDNTSTAFGNHYGGALNIPSLVNCMYGGNAIGLVSKGYQLKFANENKTIYLNSNGNLAIIDDSYTTQSAWLEGIKDLEVVFALRSENYVETSFTTASLVTENAEIPLSNNGGVLVGKCTEELSAEPGFIDAKIKLTDGDGTCYSNKLQLHVERKPS